jgi:hypothetical protein
MVDDMTSKVLLLTGFVLFGIGAERLLNAYLLGDGPSSHVRLLIGMFCVTTGSLIALTVYVRGRSRR